MRRTTLAIRRRIPGGLARVALLSVVLLMAAACSGGGGNAIDATLEDFSISLDPSTASAGNVTFDITNDGPSVHEFVVFRTDLAEDQLPTDDSGAVDEEGEGIELVDEVEDIPVDSTESLDVNLDAGSYVVICNIPGHYSQGMHTSLTVE